MGLHRSDDGTGEGMWGPGFSTFRIGGLTMEFMCHSWASSMEKTKQWTAGPGPRCIWMISQPIGAYRVYLLPLQRKEDRTYWTTTPVK